MNWQKLYNPLVIALLRSPLHRLLDKNTMLITVTGRKSGKRYTFPVSYVRDGENLLVISQQDRTWWKNLRGGAQVIVFLQGHTLQARGETFTDTEMAANILLQILQRVPAYQRLLHLPLAASGKPEHLDQMTMQYTHHPHNYGYVSPVEQQAQETRDICLIHAVNITLNAIAYGN